MQPEKVRFNTTKFTLTNPKCPLAVADIEGFFPTVKHLNLVDLAEAMYALYECRQETPFNKARLMDISYSKIKVSDFVRSYPYFFSTQAAITKRALPDALALVELGDLYPDVGLLEGYWMPQKNVSIPQSHTPFPLNHFAKRC